MQGDDGAHVSWRFKLSILALLCVQSAVHALLARYSSNILKERFSSTEVIFVAEAIKMLASSYLMHSEAHAVNKLGEDESFSTRAVRLIMNSKKIIFLVVSYAVSNILGYYALARVDASVCTVLLQLKILTTALFSVIFLSRAFSSTKWRALILLVIGCILVASPTFNQPAKGPADSARSALDAVLGIAAILAMVTISGYSAVYFESMLKRESITVWERNFQMAFFSMLLMASMTLSERSINGDYENLFQGWTLCAVLLAFIQACGGLLVAATLKYADSVLKTLASSCSIVLAVFVGYFLLNGALDIFVVLGCVCTILAICNYTWDATPSGSSTNEK